MAFFPTASDAEDAASGESAIAVVHLAFAGILFILLAVFAIFLFRKTDDETNERKQRRNQVYMICGIIIAIAIVGAPVSNLFSLHLLLVLESVAVFAFSFSWLVKGGVIWFLNDPPLAAPRADIGTRAWRHLSPAARGLALFAAGQGRRDQPGGASS